MIDTRIRPAWQCQEGLGSTHTHMQHTQTRIWLAVVLLLSPTNAPTITTPGPAQASSSLNTTAAHCIQVLKRSGTDIERMHARRIMPVSVLHIYTHRGGMCHCRRCILLHVASPFYSATHLQSHQLMCCDFAADQQRTASHRPWCVVHPCSSF